MLEQRLKKLDCRLFDALLVLAIARRPVTSATVSIALARDRAPLEADLTILEYHSLATSNDDLWACADDSVTETVLRLASYDRRRNVQRALTALMAKSHENAGRLRFISNRPIARISAALLGLIVRFYWDRYQRG